MRLSTSTNIMNFDLGAPYRIPMEDAVRACAEAGYRYIDANFCGAARPGQPLAQDSWEAWAHGIRELADSLGVTFTQSHAHFVLGGRVFDESGNRTDAALCEELMRRSVLASEIVGAQWMVVHPLSVPGDSIHYDYDKSFAYNRDYYNQWGEFAARHTVGVAIENMLQYPDPATARRYCVTAGELIELVDTIANPMVQICVDTGHAHLSGQDAPAYIRAVGKRLRATHIADNHQNKDEHFAPFNGTVPWPEVMAALREINYRHDFAFEIHHLSSHYPAAVQPDLVKFSFALGNYLLGLGR